MTAVAFFDPEEFNARAPDYVVIRSWVCPICLTKIGPFEGAFVTFECPCGLVINITPGPPT